ncbi:MAG: DsbA family protein, partial [Acidimicrobiales bacterium]
MEVVEYTDPTCSWAWGSEPKIRRLAWCYGDALSRRRVMGGLLGPDWPKDLGVEDTVAYFSDPVWLTRSAGYHAKVTEVTGMPFPGRLERLPLSSYPTCRAVKAAERQGHEVAGRLLRRFREDWDVFG